MMMKCNERKRNHNSKFNLKVIFCTSDEPEPDLPSPPEVPALSPVQPAPSPAPVSAPLPARPPVSAPSASPPADVAAVKTFVNVRLPRSLDSVVFWKRPQIESFVDRILSHSPFPGARPVAIAYIQSIIDQSCSHSKSV